ncbi:MAG: hypothetical protein KIC82_05265 [Acholeplasma sp.]|nr:hypothetical protein [Acholeplasma sp.]CCY27334.1 putative uncharacterized protein [Acholeplasma sp. CAG:878]
MKLNKIIALLMSVVIFYLTIINNNISYLLFIIVLIIPFVIKTKPIITFLYLIYTFIAIFMGFQLKFYKLIPWFDDIAHISWGFISSMIAIYLIKYFKLNNQSIIFKCLFIASIYFLTAGIWEIFEFNFDNIFNGNMQRRETGVFDTMNDIINGFIGNLLFILLYIFEYKLNIKLLINNLIDEIGR